MKKKKKKIKRSKVFKLRLKGRGELSIIMKGAKLQNKKESYQKVTFCQEILLQLATTE